MTVDEMVEDACGPIHYDKDDTTHKTRVIRWLNETQKLMTVYNWPELVTKDASFTSTGAQSYDMTSSSIAGSTFLRIVGKTVRIGDRILTVKDKAWRDAIDPNRSDTGQAYECGIEGKKYFWTYPMESSGSVIYYDWMAYATALASGGAESSISFNVERHNLLVAGTIWMGKRYIVDSDWMQEKVFWETDIKKAFRNAQAIKSKSYIITQIRF